MDATFSTSGAATPRKQTYVRVATLEDGLTAPLLSNCSRAQYVPGDPNAPAAADPAGSSSPATAIFWSSPSTRSAPPGGRRRSSGEEVFQHALIGAGPFSASDNGVLASRGKAGPTRLAWFDRTGRETGTLASPAGFRSVRLSPDSRKVLVGGIDPRTGMGNLWTGDLSRDVLTRLDLGSDDYHSGIWSPDGTRIVFSVGSMQHAPSLYALSLRGSGAPEPILPPGGIQRADDWSPDGRSILYFSAQADSGSGLWVFSVEGEAKARRLVSVSEPTDLPGAVLSGRPLGCVLRARGRPIRGVHHFLSGTGRPSPGVSVGRVDPRWKRDGRELYFVSAANEMVATDIEPGPSVRWAPHGRSFA